MEIIKENNKVYLENDDTILAYCTFPNIDEETVDINHTVVDSSLQGQGVASKLLFAVVEVLISNNQKAITSCSYAEKWFKKHPEFSYLLKKDFSNL